MTLPADLVSRLLQGIRACAGMILQARDHIDADDIIAVKIDGDTTKKIDMVAEDFLLSFIKDLKLDIDVITEESGRVSLCNTPRYLMFLDPIDGTDMLLRDIPLSNIALSIIDLETNTQQISIVYDITRKQAYIADRGKAYILKENTEYKTSLSGNSDPSKAFVSTYFVSPDRILMLSKQEKLLQAIPRFFNYGGPLEIVRIAEGKVDAHIEFAKGLKSIDYLPGIHICQLAGAVVTDLEGCALTIPNELHYRQKFVVSANQALHDKILGLLN